MSSLDAAIQLAWAGVISLRRTSCDEFPCSEAHERINLVINAHVVNEVAIIEAWLERDGDRQVLIARSSLSSKCCHEHGFVHFDIARGNDRLLSISITDELDPRLVYAQTSLAQIAEFAAGMFDPPTMRSVMISCAQPAILRSVAAPT